MLLYGTEIAQQIKTKLQNQVFELFGERKKYIAIIFLWNNQSSATYVKHKQKYWKEIWIDTIVFWQGEWDHSSFFPQTQFRTNKHYQTSKEILDLISFLNQDSDCIGIMIQLPLPEPFAPDKLKLLQAICESKDIDGLGWSLVGKNFFDMIKFTPATPKAVFTLLDRYNLGNLKGKTIAIIWQSTIVGKPLALECIKRWAIVQCFDINNTPEEIQKGCQNAEYIFSWTGQIHLINKNHTNKEKNQIFIDIWYWHLNKKPVGDIDFEDIKDNVLHITPVPWGIGPLTIASLFENIIALHQQFWSQ